MPKIMIGTRVPKDWVEELKKLTETTGQSQAELLSEAIGSYLGLDIPTVGSRLDSLELQFAELDRQFGLLRRSVGRSVPHPEIAAPVAEVPGLTGEAIDRMTTAKLKVVAADLGIRNASRLSKQDLVWAVKRKADAK